MGGVEMKLGDISEVITKGTTPSNVGEKFVDAGIRYIRSEMITNQKFISDSGFLYITPSTHEKLRRSQLESGDILFSMAGVYLGKTAILRECDVPSNTNQAVALIRLDESKCSREYVYYYLNQPSVVKYVNQISGQAAQPNINLKQIGNIEINLPPLPTQHRIATILSRYDSLIENYQKQIKLLEEAAQRLYKEWFIDLHFPGHEKSNIIDGVPEGWEKKKALDFFNMSIGKTPPRAQKQWFTEGNNGIPWVSISDMKNTMFVQNTSEGLTQEACEKHNVIIVPKGTILLSFKLTVGRVAIAGTDVCTNEAIAHFQKDGNEWKAYTLMYLRNYNYDSLGNTSGISKAVNSTIIKNMPFMMPASAILRAFSQRVLPFIKQTESLQSQIRLLTEARDRLLPKLMSGEIEV